jgi:hypothetical protein
LVTALSAQYALLVTAACGLDGGEIPDWEMRLRALRPLLHDAIQLQRAMQRAVDHQRAVERAQKADEAEEVKEEQDLAFARDYPRHFNEILSMMLPKKKKRGQKLPQQKTPMDDGLPMDPTNPKPAAKEERGSNPIKANQSQSNPNTAAPDQSALAPVPDPATEGPIRPEGPEPAREGDEPQ